MTPTPEAEGAAQGHSPLPWYVSIPDEYPEIVADATGKMMFECESVADAALIVERVNGYDALVADRDRLRKALQFYANPEIYKPHPNGLAFDRQDLSFHARATLSTHTGGTRDEP